MAEFTAPKEGEIFFTCPCFKEDPQYILNEELGAVKYLFGKSRRALVDGNVCLNRRLSTFIRMVAMCAAEIPAEHRPKFDAQVHDYLTAFLDQHPSK